MQKFERYLLHTVGNKASTVTKDLKNLRMFVTDAVKAKHMKRVDDPFLFYEYPKGKKTRVWLDQTEVVNLEAVELSPLQHLARTVYFLQHYAHGSRIGVILRLRWQDRARGRVRFAMDKGGQVKDVEETPEMSALLDSLLPTDGSTPAPTQYILPYLPAGYDRLHPRDQVRIMRNAIERVNRNLKRAAPGLGITKNITSHVARRTLATLGERALGGDLRATGSLLGHRRVSTTEIYLSERDNTEIDASARKVYAALHAGKTQVKQKSNTGEADLSDSSAPTP
jgi:integrase/recombinase XerD